MQADANRLIQEVYSENAKWRSRHQLYLCILVATLIGWIVYIALSYRSHVLSPLVHFGFLLVAGVLGQEGIGLLSRPTTPHRAAIQALAECNETAFIGSLLESIDSARIAGEHIFRADTKLYYVVIDTLARLMPQLTQSEYRMLNRREKKALYKMMLSEYREVALPAMDVVTRFYDVGAAPVLEKITRRGAKTPTALSLKEAAKGGLQRMQQTTRA